MSTTVVTSFPEEGIVKAEWSSLLTADVTGQAAQLARYPCKSVQVTGNFGSTGVVEIEGSNDGVTYFTLKDPAGGEGGEDLALSFSAAGIADISPNTAFIRPRLSTVGTAADLKIVIIGSR